MTIPVEVGHLHKVGVSCLIIARSKKERERAHSPSPSSPEREPEPAVQQDGQIHGGETMLTRSTFVSEETLDTRHSLGASPKGAVPMEDFGSLDFVVGDEAGKLSFVSFDLFDTKGAAVLIEIPLASKPTAIHTVDSIEGIDILLCGTAKGELNCISLSADSFKFLWSVNTYATGIDIRKGDIGFSLSITSLSSRTSSKSERLDLIIGREDGIIQVYSIKNIRKLNEVGPAMVHETDVTGSISNALLGLSSKDKPFILVSLRSGKILFLHFQIGDLEVPVTTAETHQSTLQSLAGLNLAGESRASLIGKTALTNGARLPKLQAPLQIENRKASPLPPPPMRCSLVTKPLNTPHVTDVKATVKSHIVEQNVPLVPCSNISVKSRLVPNFSEDCLTLIVEADCSLNCVVLESDLPLPYQTSTTSKKSILALSVSTEYETIFASEGMQGYLTIYAVALSGFSEEKHAVKALGMHERVHFLSDEQRATCNNKLTLKCEISIGEMHSWLSGCFEGLPEKPPASDVKEVKYFFKNPIANSLIACDLRKGFLHVDSNSLLTISYLRSALKQIASGRRRKIDISVKIDLPGIHRTLQDYLDELFGYGEICGDSMLCEAVKDLVANEDGRLEFLDEKLERIFLGRVEIEESYKAAEERIEKIARMVEAFYSSAAALSGIPANGSQQLKAYLKEGIQIAKSTGTFPVYGIKEIFDETFMI
ncbi:Bardet-Biedl syndrome 7 protein [Dinochytrium kinnereticum]|nr:Bardet-Biedl syndrome 7 protein [Dinochytrium kinnereticum]